ncbi:MAG: LysR substrate-binding domain-containing protein [Myxococcota bacterium]
MTLPLPTLRQLEYIVAVAEEGHFGRAARRCGVSQPALSKQIQEAEAQLEVILFERARPRVLVTPSGAPLVAQARRILMEATELVRIAQDQQGEVGGRLVLGAIPTIAPYLLPGLVAALRRTYPRLTCTLEEHRTDDLLVELRQGRVELGLLALPLPDEGLDGVDVMEEPFVVVAPLGHPLAQEKPITRDELRDSHLLLMEEGHCFRDQALEVCATAGAVPNAELKAASLSTLIRLAENGLGATLIPWGALTQEIQPHSGLVVRSFTTTPPKRQLGFRWRASSPRVNTFLRVSRLLEEVIADTPLNLPIPIWGPTPTLSPSPSSEVHP